MYLMFQYHKKNEQMEEDVDLKVIIALICFDMLNLQDD